MHRPERVRPLVRILGEVKKSLEKLTKTIGEYQQPKPTQEQPKAETESEIIVRLPVEIPEYYRAEQGDRPIKNRRDRIRLVLEVVGVIVALAIALLTLLSLRVFNGQLREMGRQSKTLQEQMQIDERPWVKVTFPAKMKHEFGQPIIVTVTIANIGKTPAIDPHGYVKVSLIDATNEPKVGEEPKDPMEGFGIGYLYPNDTPTPLNVPMVRRNQGKNEHVLFTRDMDKSLQKEQSYFVAFGSLVYNDIFGTVHTTKFCVSTTNQIQGMQVNGGPTAFQQHCLDYNQVDNNWKSSD